jgi:putative phage-type endonuclease
MQLTHEEWLEDRRRSLGGSDAAGILGLNAYTTPYSIWADKTGRAEPSEDNEAMRQGRDLEQYVATRWMEVTGKRCRRRTKVLRNPEYPFAHANVDRWVIGENAGLECKTTSTLSLKKFKNGEFPDHYYCQCMHYMAVTGADRWHLGVLILGREFKEFVIERDEDEIQALMQAEKDFWQYVESDTPPPVDGLDPTNQVINTIYNNPNDESIDMFGEEYTIEAYLKLKLQIRDLEKEKRYLEQKLKVNLKDFETGICGNHTVQWKKYKRANVSLKTLKKAYPKINLNKVMNIKTYRRFSITEREQKCSL